MRIPVIMAETIIIPVVTAVPAARVAAASAALAVAVSAAVASVAAPVVEAAVVAAGWEEEDSSCVPLVASGLWPSGQLIVDSL